MVKVYFDYNNGMHVEHVATFETEKFYIVMLPYLKREATALGAIVTESIEETTSTYEELQSHGIECHCRACSML